MTILISTQAFYDNLLFDKIKKLSNSIEIKYIYITSSLMNDLTVDMIEKYSSIKKVKIIKSQTITNNHFSKINFNLQIDGVDNEESIYSDVLSSKRWLPINMRKKYDEVTFSMNFYYDIQNYWNYFFKNNKIDSVIQLNEEHSSLDSILLRIAKKYKVKNIITSRIVGAFASNAEEYYSFYNNNTNSYILIDKFEKDETNTELTDNSDFKIFSKKYNKSNILRLKYDYNRFILLFKEDLTTLKKIKKLLVFISNRIITKSLLFNQMLYIKRLNSFYLNISEKEIDLNKKYIYYCLHFDPEANTLPKDSQSSNQLLNLRILSSSLPSDWIIYVKEHPHQLEYKYYKKILLNQLHSVDKFRSENFYNYIKSMDNVQLVSLNVNHMDLIKKSQMIASNTGTIFREANYLKKYCITFSKKSIYNELLSVFYVNDIMTCKKAIEKITNSSFDKSTVNEVFSKYSLTIKKIENRSGHLFDFIIKNKLYKMNND
ncbi:MAG: hypothetical protein CL624_04735 [Arcobacter sp.]|nr:hypothetical protein [Arcobacter sp.]|tara:strand:+ start:8902 stop:10362 length:1461 start_codon:yes stop_codon:yes gene_type:complete